MGRIELDKGWEVRYEDMSWGPEMGPAVLERKDGWLKADLPFDVHMPLIQYGLMKEPLEADNCFDAEWIEKKSWWFKKGFQVDDGILRSDVVELNLESLDAEGDVFLNGFYLGHHRSAFYPFTMDVKKYLHQGDNTLLIRLTSGLEYYNQRDVAYLKEKVCTEQAANRGHRGDQRRVFVRKPQYVYGWDWGPRVATCGIMKGAWLEPLTSLAVRGVHVVTESISPEAVLRVEVEVENLHLYATRESRVSVEIMFGKDKVALTQKDVLLRSGINFIELKAVIDKPKLWWPNGMGDQPLYTVNVSAETGGAAAGYPSFKYGIRTVRLNQDRISKNERLFAIEINGIRTFCKGGNWIPADSIYARITDEKYDTLLREAKEANFNMLRIWGGGIYERDIFYQKCDEYGIMLWHDFMFACALYPDHLEWFRKEVENEINYQTKRLRNHSSIVLWCANNENEWIFMDEWKGGRSDSVPGGLICYNEIAPRIVRQNCPNTPYWNSSPYGGEEPNANNIGDRHHWHDCTMNPDMEKRITPEEYDKVTSKFISEYGYIGPCRKSSIIKYHGGAKLDRESTIWQLHNNTFEKQTVPAGIAKHYADPEKLDIDQYLLYAGLVQGLMLGYSLESIRFKENCSGSLFWMYDDCWGEVGWTIIDYYLKRKVSYYFVKRAFAPLKLIMREQEGMVKVMGVNDTPENKKFSVEYGYTSFDGKQRHTQTASINLEPYSRSVVLKFEKGDFDFTRGICYVKPDTQDILPATLRTGNYKDLQIPKANLKVDGYKVDGEDVTFNVSSDVFVHGVHFNLDDDIKLSDEYFDLLPGESRSVRVYKAADRISLEDIHPVE